MKMSKWTCVGIVLAGGMIAGTATPALAVTDTAITDGKVTFQENTDPGSGGENPGGDGGTPGTEPGGSTGGGGSGLKIDYVSHMKFGTQKISGSTQNYHPLLTDMNYDDGSTVYVPQFIQVTDDSGSLLGWKIQVARTEFSTAGGEVLDGTTLSVKNAQLVDISNEPRPEPSTALSTFEIPVGSPITIVEALANEGTGSWAHSFGAPKTKEQASTDATATNDSVTLTVPGATKKVKDVEYTSKLTWTLLNTEI